MHFFDAVVTYETQLWNYVDLHVRNATGISLGTLGALRVARQYEGVCRVQELRQELGISVGAASKLVDRLEHSQLAQRGVHPHDRRSSLISLTAAGRAALAHGEKVARAALAHHLDGEEGLAQAQATLLRLRDKLSAQALGEA